MTIDERLEALTMNMELAAHESEAQRWRIHEISENVDRLVDIVENLAGVAASHERRLTNL